MSFSIIPLLLAGKTISIEVKRALRENRLHDAGKLLMQKYGLSCAEAGDLLNLSAC